MVRYFILVVFITMNLMLSAQNCTIAGTLGSVEGVLPSANVKLILINDTLNISYTTTDLNGSFIIRNILSGVYKISFSFVSYEAIVVNVDVKEKFTDMGYISLTKKAINISGIKVVESSLAVQQIGDTVQYNASSYKTKPDANADELLLKMPGIGYKEGVIQAQGESVKQVLIDGEPFFGGDPNAALKNIPAEIIEKIQVFDQQSEQSKFSGFDDGNTLKTVNIIIKKEFKDGKFGNAYAGYGYEDKYTIGGVMNSFHKDQKLTILAQSNNINQQNFSTDDLAGVLSSTSNTKGQRGGGKGSGAGKGSSSASNINDFLVGEEIGIINTNSIGLNYSNKFGNKLKISSSYFFNQSENNSETLLTREYFSNNELNQVYDESNGAKSQNINHRFNIKLDYSINRNNSIIITPKLSIQKYKGISDIYGQTLIGDSILNTTHNNFDSDINSFIFSNSILWRHRFNKRGRTLMISLNQEINDMEAESFLKANNYFSESNNFDTVNQNVNMEQFEQLYSSRISYTEPIFGKAHLIFSYTPILGINSIDKTTFNLNTITDSYNLLDSNMSNFTNSNLMKHKIGAGARFRFKKNMFMLNLYYEISEFKTEKLLPNQQSVNKHYSTLLPVVMWRYVISRKENIRAFYRTNTVVPSVEQLQEVVDNSNPLQLSVGNSDLHQEYNHNIFIKYSATNTKKNTVLFAMLSGNYISSYIGYNTTIANSKMLLYDTLMLEAGTQISQLENLNGYYNLKALLTYGKPIAKVNINFSTSFSFNQIPSIINSELNYVKIPSLDIGVVASSNISDKIDFTIKSNTSLYYTYNSLNSLRNSKYINQEFDIKMYYNFCKTYTLRNELQYQYYHDITDNNNTDYYLWNVSLGRKLFKNHRAELIITVHDILNQNTKINRVSTGLYIQDSKLKTIGTYVMLSFKYRFALAENIARN